MLVAEKLSVLFRDLEFTEAVDVELSDERVHIVVLKVARKHLFWELLRVLDIKGIAPAIPKRVVTLLLVRENFTSMIL